jgi:hypothetical protein
MAVDTGKASLLMDVRPEVMLLNSIRTGRIVFFSIRGTVFPVKIVFIPAVIVRSDPVGIMTA